MRGSVNEYKRGSVYAGKVLAGENAGKDIKSNILPQITQIDADHKFRIRGLKG